MSHAPGCVHEGRSPRWSGAAPLCFELNVVGTIVGIVAQSSRSHWRRASASARTEPAASSGRGRLRPKRLICPAHSEQSDQQVHDDRERDREHDRPDKTARHEAHMRALTGSLPDHEHGLRPLPRCMSTQESLERSSAIEARVSASLTAPPLSPPRLSLPVNRSSFVSSRRRPRCRKPAGRRR